MNIGHVVSGEYLHPVGTEAAPSLRRCSPSNRGRSESVLNSSAVDMSSFDRQLLSAQWRPGAHCPRKIIHARELCHTPGRKHAERIERTIRAI